MPLNPDAPTQPLGSTTSPGPADLHRRLPVYLLAYAAALFICYRYGLEVMAGGHDYKTGDWLINYTGGLVRRGLAGQLLLELSHLGFNLLWTTFTLQCALYLLTTHYVLKLFFATERGDAWLLLLFSPAFIFLFPAYNLQAGFRKEVLVYLSYCLLCYGLLRGQFSRGHMLASLILYALAAFSHELATLCLPFMVYPLLKARRAGAPRALIDACIVGYVLLAGAGFLLANLFPGNAQVAQHICDSLISAGLNRDICGGAIGWLSMQAGSGVGAVASEIRNYLEVYPVLFLLAGLPLLLTDWPGKRLPLLATGFIGLLPLFVVGVDWGRWLHIYITLLSITLLHESAESPVKIRKLPGIALFAYMLLWDLPHCCAIWPGTWLITMLRDMALGRFTL